MNLCLGERLLAKLPLAAVEMPVMGLPGLQPPQLEVGRFVGGALIVPSI